MKIITTIALVAILMIDLTDYGWLKLIGLIILAIDALFLAKRFEEDLC